VPANDARWLGKPVALLFDFGGEAMVWSESGVALQGMNGQSGDDRRDEFVAIESARAGQQVTLYLELACNELFGNSKWNVGPCEPDVTRGYSIKQCEIAILDRDVWALLWDFVVISDIARVGGCYLARSHEIAAAAATQSNSHSDARGVVSFTCACVGPRQGRIACGAGAVGRQSDGECVQPRRPDDHRCGTTHRCRVLCASLSVGLAPVCHRPLPH